jgi:peptidoglycan/xylan/chitin deacetylase (PgdA/CDA1 family)
MAPLKRAVAWGLLRSGVLRVHRSRFERGWAILLLYHRVNDDGDPCFPSLRRSLFAAQLDYLASRYRVEALDDVVTWLEEGAQGPPRVALTFDDGYPDTLEIVSPELSRRGLPATLFLATGPPETGRPLWTDRTRWIVKHATARVLDLPLLGLPPTPLDGAARRAELLKRLLRLLKTLVPVEVDRAVQALEVALEPEGPLPRLLSWPHVRRLAAGSMALGAHTHRHYMLSRLDDRTQEDEVATSVRLIEQRTEARVSCFAYPNGEPSDYDERAMAVLRRLGLRYAVTSRHALARPRHDAFQLPRLYTSEPSLALFAARLAGLGREEPGQDEVS